MLSHIAASGVELPDGKVWNESSAVHVKLALRHLRRFFMLLLCGHGPQLDPEFRVGTEGLDTGDTDDGDGEVRHNEDGVPDARQLARRGLIIPSTGSWKEKWDLLILLLIFYSAVTVPLRVCFAAEAEGWLWTLDVCVTFLFLLDVYFSFNTVFLDYRTGEWVIDRWRIARAYFFSWFWIDVPSSVPVEVIDVLFYSEGPSNPALGLLRVLRLFRLLRLLRLLKIDEYIETLESRFDVNLRALRIVFMLAKICFLAHGLGCFWYGVHLVVASGYVDGGEAALTTWAYTYDNGRPATSETPLQIRYLYAVYWSVTTLTTVGYGDVTPTNSYERLFALCTMLVSAVLFGMLISNIGTLVASMDRQAAKVEERLDAVKEYAKFRRLPRDLATRVKKHYSFYFTQRSGFDEVELLGGLPPSLGSEVTKYVLRETLGRLPLFGKVVLDPEFQAELFPLIKPVSYQPGEIIFKRGEPSLDLIFLLAGEVNVLSPLTEQKNERVVSKLTPTEEIILSSETPPQKVMELKHMGAFGSTVLTGRRRTQTHTAHTLCQVLVLSKADLQYLFARNPLACRRVKDVLLSEVERKERMQVLYMRFVIGALHGDQDPKAVVRRACLIIQKSWKRYAKQMHSAEMLIPDDGEEMDDAQRFTERASALGARPPRHESTAASTHALPSPSVLPPPGAAADGNKSDVEESKPGTELDAAGNPRGKLSRKKKLHMINQTERAIADVFADLKAQLSGFGGRR